MKTTAEGAGILEAERTLRASVVTMTPSPAVDRVYLVDAIQAGEVNRARQVHSYLSGKGINVARNLRGAGAAAVAVTTLSDGDRHLVGDDDLYRIVAVSQPTRVNTVVISGDGATTNVNERPHPLTGADWERVCAATSSALREREADWLVVAGSIPARGGERAGSLSPGSLAEAASARGARVCLDSGGHSLREWLDQGFVPDLVKPNLAELSAAAGRELVTVADAIGAAHGLLDRGTGAVLASLGADGALLVTPTHRMWARAPRVEAVNTTGAGDAAVAGFIADHVGEPTESLLIDALRRAVAWGALAVREVETVPSSYPDVPGIVVDDPPLGRRLHVRN